jgi:uncharacterized protein YqjF (DUF2071 family)
VPFELDLREGRAYVSLVEFAIRRMRIASLGRAGEWLMRPMSDHWFLNARTYVRAGGLSGIHFMAEWLSNRLCIPLGRPAFGLPYYYANFARRKESGGLSGSVAGKLGRLTYRANVDSKTPAGPCRANSLDEFLLERYTAFTQWRSQRRFFRVWHEPWPVTPIDAVIEDSSLLERTGGWIAHARLVGAHYSPGVRGVWIGAPQFL